MKNPKNNNYLFEDNEIDDSKIESSIINNAEIGINNAKTPPEPCPVEGFDINEIAEAIASAVEYRRFIRNKRNIK